MCAHTRAIAPLTSPLVQRACKQTEANVGLFIVAIIFHTRVLLPTAKINDIKMEKKLHNYFFVQDEQTKLRVAVLLCEPRYRRSHSQPKKPLDSFIGGSLQSQMMQRVSLLSLLAESSSQYRLGQCPERVRLDIWRVSVSKTTASFSFSLELCRLHFFPFPRLHLAFSSCSFFFLSRSFSFTITLCSLSSLRFSFCSAASLSFLSFSHHLKIVVGCQNPYSCDATCCTFFASCTSCVCDKNICQIGWHKTSCHKRILNTSLG